MGLFKIFGPKDSVPTRLPFEPIHLARGPYFNLDVVGEASYQNALDKLCGGKCEQGHELPSTAQLCFQEDNPHDENAVVVLIERQVVGYIPRDLAPWIRSEILRINPEERPVTCEAKIVGGWSRGPADEGHYGVKLSIAKPIKATSQGLE